MGDAFRWAYLPYSMKMAGPREAIQDMIIRKNFGATHFIIGRDMAGTKNTLTSDDFYGAFEAQEMGKKHSAELDVTVVDYPNQVYVGEEHGNARGYMSDTEAKKKGVKIQKLSGTEFRKRLRSGDEIPEWFAFPAVVIRFAMEVMQSSCECPWCCVLNSSSCSHLVCCESLQALAAARFDAFRISPRAGVLA